MQGPAASLRVVGGTRVLLLSWEAEDVVIRRAGEVFADAPVPVEVRNEARVHLWYAEHFGSPAPRPFTDCRDAVDHFAAVCCCVGVSVRTGEVYAPHGFDDLFGLVVRPNPVLAPRHVYEAKAARWQAQWPELTVLPIAPLLARAIREVFDDGSVTSLFDGNT